MNRHFEEIRGNFGFGCMRLPMQDGEVDTAGFTAMVDAFLQAGFNYFDTAHGYLGGKSETALRECLTKRHDRSAFLLTNKLTGSYFEQEADIRPFFESQLAACGVDYFDFYLMHAQHAEMYKKFQACRAYEIASELKAEGKIRHVGLSFHDKAEVLDRILTDHPGMDVVQIQFNYVDYEDGSIQSRLCYEVCRKHNKPMIVMEPVKGGSLISLPPEAMAIVNELGGSPASYAIRYAASFPGMEMVLSGMSNMEQMKQNIGFMKDFVPLNETEFSAIGRVREIFRAQKLIPCTACRYCVDGCPQNIAIPDLLSCMNTRMQYGAGNTGWHYLIRTQNAGKASDCIECAACEDICPQHLDIRALLKDVANAFESR